MLQGPDHLRNVRTHRLRKIESLVVGRHAGPQQHVVDRLRELAHAGLADMHDITPERLHDRLGLFICRRRAAAEHRQRPVVGRLLTEHHGRVEDADTLRVSNLLELLRGIDRTRAGHADHRALCQAIKQAGFDDHVFHLRVGRHHHDHDFRIGADLRRRADNSDARGLRSCVALGQHIDAVDLESLFHHVPRHLIAHGAEADHACLGHAVFPSCSAVWIVAAPFARRFAVPGASS